MELDTPPTDHDSEEPLPRYLVIMIKIQPWVNAIGALVVISGAIYLLIP